MNKKNIYYVIGGLIFVLVIGILVFDKMEGIHINTQDDKTYERFNIALLQKVQEKESNKNYLVSPYSIEIALNMLRDGAKGETKKQITDLIGTGDVSTIKNDKLHMANALFVKNEYQNKLLKNYQNDVKKYDAEILVDEFTTPKIINDWVKEQTDNTIEKILDDIDKDFVLGLANALYIDLNWHVPFECMATKSEEFTKADGSKINVAMMHNNYHTDKYKYFEINSAKGVIIPYSEDDKMEFVGILPNDITSYINNLNIHELESIDENSMALGDEWQLKLSLPSFKYSYDFDKFMEVLKELGIVNAFDANLADFTNIMKRDISVPNLYISKAIHKTYIDLNEKGTKASAVTYFGMSKSTAISDTNVKEIIFNKPFIYLIRDTKTKKILFMGSVYEPNLWKGSTCEK